jgi:hypothetical protein
MLRFRDLSLSLQLPLVAAASALAVGLSIVWLATTSSDYLQEERERRFGEALARLVAVTARDPLQRGDLLSLRASLQRFIDDSLAIGVSIRDVEGTALGVAGRMEAAGVRQYQAPITIGKDTAGEVLVLVNSDGLDDSRWRFVFSLIALAAALSLLVFMLTRALAQHLSSVLLALGSQLALPPVNATPGSEPGPPPANELQGLLQTVALLPIDMLRSEAPVPQAASEFHERTVLFVHLASLVRYVNTLSESNLHRYSRRLQQMIGAAAQCYRGSVKVTRPFGLLISFADQDSAGSEALRAMSCARLIARIATGLEERTRLSLELAMALGQCESATDNAVDMYPELYLQGTIDDLREGCLACTEYPVVLVSAAVLADEQLRRSAQWAAGNESRGTDSNREYQGADLSELLQLAPERESLIDHQAQLIIERITPRKTGDD